jgi:hypothetical protein
MAEKDPIDAGSWLSAQFQGCAVRSLDEAPARPPALFLDRDDAVVEEVTT